MKFSLKRQLSASYGRRNEAQNVDGKANVDQVESNQDGGGQTRGGRVASLKVGQNSSRHLS